MAPVADMSNDQGERGVRDQARNRARHLAGEAAVVIDPRLADLWQMVWRRLLDAGETVPLATLAPLLRLAYALGYADAHTEEEAGALFADLGLRPQVRRSRSGRRSRRG